MQRREFIKYAMCGLTGIAVGGLDLPPIFQRQANELEMAPGGGPFGGCPDEPSRNGGKDPEIQE